jgi:hypothetical protein
VAALGGCETLCDFVAQGFGRGDRIDDEFPREAIIGRISWVFGNVR